MNTEIIVLGGGCFWCTEAVFKMLKGIVSVAPGYAGGEKNNPTYESVSKGGTKHVEVIRVEYDPKIIPLKNILTVFFATHDSTTLNRQGNDIGEQYRSIILFTSENQKKEAGKFIEELNKSSAEGKPVVTEVKPLEKFFPAEDYHKNYYESHPESRYCEVIIAPKLQKVQKNFAKLLNKNI